MKIQPITMTTNQLQTTNYKQNFGMAAEEPIPFDVIDILAKRITNNTPDSVIDAAIGKVVNAFKGFIESQSHAVVYNTRFKVIDKTQPEIGIELTRRGENTSKVPEALFEVDGIDAEGIAKSLGRIDKAIRLQDVVADELNIHLN